MSLSDKIETNPWLGSCCKTQDVRESVQRIKERIAHKGELYEDGLIPLQVIGQIIDEEMGDKLI